MIKDQRFVIKIMNSLNVINPGTNWKTRFFGTTFIDRKFCK